MQYPDYYDEGTTAAIASIRGRSIATNWPSYSFYTDRKMIAMAAMIATQIWFNNTFPEYEKVHHRMVNYRKPFMARRISPRSWSGRNFRKV